MADGISSRYPFQRLGTPLAETMVRHYFPDDDAAHVSADAFFARGPVSCCPAALCVRTLCRSACAAPVGLCRFALTFRPDVRCLSPCVPPEVRFDAIVATIRALSLTTPRNIVAMQAITDLGTAQPCLCCLMAHTLGDGVASAAASSDVLSSTATDGLFSERGVWLFPQNSARFPPAFPDGFPETFAGRLCIGADGRCLLPCFAIDGSGGCSRSCEVCCGCCAAAGPAPPLPSSGARVILFLHGGAFVLTNAETYPTMIGFELVRRTGASVLFPNFARPPQARFPSQLLALSVLLKKLIRFYGAGRVAVAGDSAGANLVIGTVLYAMADGCPPPCCLLLFSPWADLSPDAQADTSRTMNRTTDYLAEDLVQLFSRSYVAPDAAWGALGSSRGSPAIRTRRDLEMGNRRESDLDLEMGSRRASAGVGGGARAVAPVHGQRATGSAGYVYPPPAAATTAAPWPAGARRAAYPGGKPGEPPGLAPSEERGESPATALTRDRLVSPACRGAGGTGLEGLPRTKIIYGGGEVLRDQVSHTPAVAATTAHVLGTRLPACSRPCQQS